MIDRIHGGTTGSETFWVDMEINQARYFLAVCSERNFTRAAKKCGISQPSLTRAIKLLEAEFGGDLFDRKPGHIGLTELGSIVLPYLQTVWEQTTAVKKLARNAMAPKPALVRLGVMCTIAPALLIEVVANFRDRQPQSRLEIVDGTARELEEKLLASDLDIAIFARPKRPRNSRINYMDLFREQMMIVVPKTHRFAQLPRIRVADLASENYVMRALCEFAEPAEAESEQAGSWEAAYQSDRDDWVFAMIESGFGFGFVPYHSAPADRFAIIPLVEPEFWREVHLTTVLGRPQTPAVGALVHEVMQRNWPLEQKRA